MNIKKNNIYITILWVLCFPILIIVGSIVDIFMYLQTYKLRKNHQFIDVDGSIKNIKGGK